MVKLVHLSDVHLQLDWRQRSLRSTGWRGLLGRIELQAFGRMHKFALAQSRLQELLARPEAQRADQLVVTGDLSSLGDEQELAIAQELFDPWARAGRLALVPGNHDRATDKPEARAFERVFKAQLETEQHKVVDGAGYPWVRLLGTKHALVGLDSTRVPGIAHYFVGRLGGAQLSALRDILDSDALRGRTVLLMLHHGPTGPGGKFSWKESALLDAKKLQALIDRRDVVVLHGHSHVRFWWPPHGGQPHVLGGGSSTEPGRDGAWAIEVHDRLRVDARLVR